MEKRESIGRKGGEEGQEGGEGAQCIRIGVMEDNIDFGHFLHFRQY